MSGARTLEDDDRYGWMASAVAQVNIYSAESLTNKHMIWRFYGEAHDIMEIFIGRSRVHSSRVRKCCASRVPRNPSEEQTHAKNI